MTSTALLEDGGRRVRDGLNLIGQAIKDAIVGLYGVANGLVLLTIGGVWAAGSGVAAPARAAWRYALRVSRLKLPRFQFKFRMPISGRTFFRGVGITIAAAAFAAAVAFTLGLADGLTILTKSAAALGYIAGAVVLALVIVAIIQTVRHIRWPLPPPMPQMTGRTALIVVAVAALGAITAWLALTGRASPLVAIFAILTLVAGSSGVAVFSFGPTRAALFSIRTGGDREVTARSETAIDAAFERVTPIGAPSQPRLEAPAPAAMRIAGRASGADLHAMPRAPTMPRVRAAGAASPGWWGTLERAAPRLAITIAIGAVLLAAWIATEPKRLATAPHEKSVAVVASSKGVHRSTRAISAPQATGVNAPASSAAAQPVAPFRALGLSADGAPAEIAWRPLYAGVTRTLAAQKDVARLALPPGACGASALVVFGAASSDGSPSRNRTLAAARALWLARWTHASLARCVGADGTPAVVSVTLGPSQANPATPAQRRVRIMAIAAGSADARSALTETGHLRKRAAALFPDLKQFPLFDVCIYRDGRAAAGSLAGLRMCEAPH